MDSNIVVDLSSGESDNESIRKDTDQQKWKDLSKYIPFLEYITSKDPVKNATYTKLLHWLKKRVAYPARVSYMCETRIRKRYEKLKSSMEFPPNVIAPFTKVDAIVISDEDEPRNSDDNRVNENPTKASTSQKETKSRATGIAVKNTSTISSVPNRKTSNTNDTNIDIPTTTNQSAASSTNKCDRVNTPSSPIKPIEDGEILSDNEDGSIQQNESDDASRTGHADVENSKVIETEDDILNNDLFKRIDSLAGDDIDLKSNRDSEVQAQKSPVLQQNNVERERRKSPQPLHLLLSPVSDEELSKSDHHRKKKKKKKSRRKSVSHTSDWYISEAENALDHTTNPNSTLKQKICRRDSAFTGDDKRIKRKKCDKKRKEKYIQSRPLYIISDEDDDEKETNMPSRGPNVKVKSPTPESELFQRRNPDRDTVVLLDSDEDDQTQSTVTPKPPSPTPTPLPLSEVLKAAASPEKINEKKKVSKPSAIGDLNNMDLEELSDVYSKLCQTTGIQLEELLSDLVIQSTNVKEQAPAVWEEQFNQIDLCLNSSPNNNNNLVCTEGDFEQHQRHLQLQQHNQELEQQNQHLKQQQQQLLQHQHQQQQHQQQQQQQMQQTDQMLCNVPPATYTYQNNLMPRLNLKDPRIVQKLKQIQDSPIYNMGIRESATILVNLHSPCTQRRPAQVTAKTATTYGEHKRLRELEKQKQLERQNAEKCTVVTNDQKVTPPSVQTENSSRSCSSERTSNPSPKKEKSKRSNSTESESGKEKSKERNRTSSGSDSGRKTPHEKDARTRTNSSGSEGGRKAHKSNEDGRTTPKASEKPKSMRKQSSGSESGRSARKSSQSDMENNDEDITRRRCSLNRKARLRIESESSDDNASLPTPGSMTALEMGKVGKVVDIVLSVMNKSSESSGEVLKSRSRSNSMRKSKDLDKSDSKAKESNQKPAATVSKDSENESAREPNLEADLGRELMSIGNGNKSSPRSGRKSKRGRSRGTSQSSSTSKASNAHKKGCRELSNLNCTFLDYREMFEKNWLPTTIDGKRRCIAPTGSMMEDHLGKSEENLIRSSEKRDDVFEPKQTVTAAPIKRRRQTCSALQRPSSSEKAHMPAIKVVLRRLSAGGKFGIEETSDTINVSDDTDEFDLEEHRKPPAPKDKDPFEPRLTVSIKKLSPSDIQDLKAKEKMARKNSLDSSISTSDSIKQNEFGRNLTTVQCNDPIGLGESSSESTLFVENAHTRNADVQEMPILVPYTSKVVDNPSKMPTKPPKHSNIDITMLPSTTKTCLLCNKRPLDLTNHYVVQHKTESYVSRLSSAEIEDLETNIKLAVPYRKRYKVVCVFCQDELEDLFDNFHDHYSYHTGEYAYRCDVCELVKPYRPDVRSHQLRTSRCRNGKIRTDYRYKSDLTVIYLYVCKLCNFVQLNEANIHKHHRDHHGFRFDEPQHVKTCIIAAVDNTEVANEVMPSNSQEDNSNGENIQVEDSETRQAQEFVHEHPLDIKEENQNQSIMDCTQSVKLEVPDLSHFESLLDDMHRDNVALDSEAAPSPEALLEQLHCSQTSSNVMTVIHTNNATVCKEKHQPYTEPVDVKPNLNDIQIGAPFSQAPTAAETAVQPLQRTFYRNTTSDSAYFGMYKCMFPDCWFSTNMDTRFIQHTTSHVSNSSFRCAYCRSKNSSAEKLVRHVRSRHSMSRYQCSDCTYRSMIPGNVSIHRSICHKDSAKDKGIYECVFRFKPMEERLLALHNKMMSTITSLKCPDCSALYYATSSIKLHIQTEHPQSFDKLDMSMFNEFACIHCKTELNSKESMQIHLAEVHPDEMGYVAERKLKGNATKDCAENISMVNISKRIAPMDIHPAEFVEPEPDPEFAATNDQPSLEESSPQPAESVLNGPTSAPPDEEQTESIGNDPEGITSIFQAAVHTITKEEQLTLERMKLFLDLLTENTGIDQANLYRCTECSASFLKYEFWLTHMTNRHSITEVISCPYCSQQLPIASAAPHFESHSRHQYICLHCIKTFSTHDQVQEHFIACHKDCPKFSGKKLKFGLKPYYIVQKQDLPIVDWLPVYKVMSDEIRVNLVRRLHENTLFEWWEGLDSACLEEINIPQFITNGQDRYKCPVRSCTFVGLDESQLDVHLNIHTIPREHKCSHCDLILTTPSWETIKNHNMLHKGELFICCVCKYIHHNPGGILKHIENLHNIRDVPVVTMSRDERNYKTSLSIVLAAGRAGFTTTVACFCCEKPMKNNSVLLQHLKKHHDIKLIQKCARCDKVLLTQIDAKEHSTEHGMQVFKLRYDILTTSLDNVNVKSLAPFCIEMRPKQNKRHREDEAEEFSLKKVKVEEQQPPINEDVIIKTEVDEDSVADNASNSQGPGGAIKCVNINHLVQNVNTATPEEIHHRPEVGRIFVKSAAQLQMSSNLQYKGFPQALASNQPVQQVSIRSTSEQVVANIPLPNNRGTAFISTSLLTANPASRLVLQTALPATPRIQTAANLSVAHYSLQNSLPSPKDESHDEPHDNRTCDCPKLPEIATICKHCMKECTDFCHLREHYDAVHAPKKQRFLFRISRKVKCMHCTHHCSTRSLVAHHFTFHPDRARMCHSVLDHTRCGFCNEVFDFLPTSTRSICACPMSQRVLADCLDSQTLKALQTYGVKHYEMKCVNYGICVPKPELVKTIAYLCNICDKIESDVGMTKIIAHYRKNHITSWESFAGRINYYKKIGIIYPRGLILTISDLQTFNEEDFKQDILKIEAAIQ